MLIFLLAPPAAAVDLRVGPTQPFADVQSALDVAATGDRVLIDPGTFAGDVSATGLVGVEILGAGSDPATGTVLAGGGGFTILTLVDTAQVTLRSLVIDGGGTERGMSVSGTSPDLHIEDVRVQGGTGLGGGGIWLNGTTVATVSDCVFEGNATSPAYSGAGLRIESGASAVVATTVFSGNASGFNGGGLWSEGAVEVTDCTFEGNVAQNHGAGLYCASSPDCQILDSTFEGGTADRGGGAYLYNSVSAVVRGSFCDNLAVLGPLLDAGGLGVDLGTADIRNSVFVDNAANDDAGGLRVWNGSVVVHNNTFVGNNAVNLGSAFRMTGSTGDWVNNLVTGNVSGLAPFSALEVTLSTYTGGYNLYFANQTTDTNGLPFPTDVLGADPLLPANPGCSSASVLPGPGSAALDAGDPALLDPDGTVSDIGATGGPDAVRDQDLDGYVDGVDCNDLDPAVSPGAPEVCNGIDDDCDGMVDVGAVDAQTWYPDTDGDTFGDITGAQVVCQAPALTWVGTGGDCDDDDAAVNPLATEVCGGLDDDCDGAIDDDDPDVDAATFTTFYVDGDQDGFGGTQTVAACAAPAGAVEVTDDCDDDDPSVFPGATEVCNGADDDCDTVIDEDCDEPDPDPDPDPDPPGGEREASTLQADEGASAGCACGQSGGTQNGLAWLAGLLLLGWRRRSRV